MWSKWGEQKIFRRFRWGSLLKGDLFKDDFWKGWVGSRKVTVNNTLGKHVVRKQNWIDVGYGPPRIFIVICVSVIIDALQMHLQKLFCVSLTHILCFGADWHVTSCGLEASDVATRLWGYDFSRMFSTKTNFTATTNEGVWRLCVSCTKRRNWNTEVSLSRQLVEGSAA